MCSRVLPASSCPILGLQAHDVPSFCMVQRLNSYPQVYMAAYQLRHFPSTGLQNLKLYILIYSLKCLHICSLYIRHSLQPPLNFLLPKESTSHFCLNFMSYFYIYLFVYLFEFTLIGLTINAAHIFMGTGTITVTPFLKKRSFPRSY